MSSPVTAQYLLEGGAYALEQCGLLLRDANMLYRSNSYANTVVLTAFAQEELGHSIILFQLRKKLLHGENITIEDIKKCGDKHLPKQEAGMLGATIRVPDSGRQTSMGHNDHASSKRGMENSKSKTEGNNKVEGKAPTVRPAQSSYGRTLC